MFDRYAMSVAKNERLTADERRAAAISIHGLDRRFTTGALYNWGHCSKEERHRIDQKLKQVREKREQQILEAKARHYTRTSFAWKSENYRADEGPWDQPLISGFRLSGVESGHPQLPFAPLVSQVLSTGLAIHTDAGEEWCDGQAAFNILDAVEQGVTRLCHGIHALAAPSIGLPYEVGARLSSLGFMSLTDLLKARNIPVEVRAPQCNALRPSLQACLCAPTVLFQFVREGSVNRIRSLRWPSSQEACARGCARGTRFGLLGDVGIRRRDRRASTGSASISRFCFGYSSFSDLLLLMGLVRCPALPDARSCKPHWRVGSTEMR